MSLRNLRSVKINSILNTIGIAAINLDSILPDKIAYFLKIWSYLIFKFGLYVLKFLLQKKKRFSNNFKREYC